MSDIAIKVENLGKLYRLGEIGTGTLSHDLNRAWARLRGKEDPLPKLVKPTTAPLAAPATLCGPLKM